MKEKARRNLEAARMLVSAGLGDPAASRIYYAAFQAAVTLLDAKGITPDQARVGATYWKHDMVVNHVSRLRNNRADERLLRTTKSWREQADYMPEPVDPQVVKSYLAEVEKFVKELLP